MVKSFFCLSCQYQGSLQQAIQTPLFIRHFSAFTFRTFPRNMLLTETKTVVDSKRIMVDCCFSLRVFQVAILIMNVYAEKSHFIIKS